MNDKQHRVLLKRTLLIKNRHNLEYSDSQYIAEAKKIEDEINKVFYNKGYLRKGGSV